MYVYYIKIIDLSKNEFQHFHPDYDSSILYGTNKSNNGH